MLEERRAAVLCAEPGSHATGRDAVDKHRGADRVPDLDRHRVEVGVGLETLQVVEDRPHVRSARAVHPDVLQEALLVLGGIEIQVVAGAMLALLRDLDAPLNAEPEQEILEVADQSQARRAVVDARLTYLPVEQNAAVGCPKMADEERHLLERKSKHLPGNELLVAAKPVEAEPPQPGLDRILTPVGQRVR